MSNSSLVSYTQISPNRTSPRSSTIDTITIHCVVGQCSVEGLGSVFAPSSRKASSNYGVGYDGRIGMYVEEKDRSWCSSSSYNDNRAITIEVASDTTPPYAVTDAAYNATIKLVADICKRNGITKLVWSTNKNDRVNHLNGCNMTVHRDYANKSCPGDYLYNRMGDIAAKVNALIGKAGTPNTWEQVDGKWYRYDENGAMVTGWKWITRSGMPIPDYKCYYFNSSGVMQTGWKKSGGIWYYLLASGAMATEYWVKYDNKWYYMNADGSMFDDGWIWIGGKCYYFNEDGTMAENTTIDGFVVGADGAWIST